MEKHTCSRKLVVSPPLLPVEVSASSSVPSSGSSFGNVTYQSPPPPLNGLPLSLKPAA